MFVLGVDQNVIQVNDHKFINKGAEDIVHEAHEGGGSIGEAKGKNQEFITSKTSLERSLVDVIGMDPGLMITRPEIKGGEVLGAMELIKEFIRARERVTILDGDRVKLTIVDAEAEGSISFLGKEDRGTILRCRRADPTLFKVDLELTL
jgi:hypothetical protein